MSGELISMNLEKLHRAARRRQEFGRAADALQVVWNVSQGAAPWRDLDAAIAELNDELSPILEDEDKDDD